MRVPALRALAAFNSPETAAQILDRYGRFNETARSDAIQTLASRASWSLLLLDAIEHKKIARTDVSVFVARQMQGHKDPRVKTRLASVWGQIQPASQVRAAQMTRLKKQLSPESIRSGNLGKGRLIFSKNCASCHRLYDDGGDIGPALTGSQRHNLDYLLENILDPSSIVAKEYQMSKVDLLDGRTINGIIKQETDKAISIRTPNELLVMPKDEIEKRQLSPLSMMPEGIFDKLSESEIRDLVAYLMSKTQVPLPPTK